jgi:hypothetical protein
MVMGITPVELAKYYPRLYHMAEQDSFESIKRHGLLGTEALVQLFEVPTDRRRLILGQQRTKSEVIEHPRYGKATIRDQKPLNRSKLEGCLQGCSFQDWLHMLNSRVFFWLTIERLRTLMCAREYCAKPHVVLVLDTLRLANDLHQTITLAPMNTGNTRPYTYPRGLSTFSRMTDYPLADRLHRGLYYMVVELAVETGVGNIMDYLIEATEMQCSSCERTNSQHIRSIKRLFP